MFKNMGYSRPTHHKNESDWQLIGQLKCITNYPIDNGFGFNTNVGLVTPFGIQTYSYARRDSTNAFSTFHYKMFDRDLIAFKDGKAVLFDPQLSEINNSSLIFDFKAGKLQTIETINYLGKPMKVYNVDTSTALSNAKKFSSENKKLPWQFGYLPQNLRHKYFHDSVYAYETTENDKRYLSNYSPFTLINTKSLEALAVETGKHNLLKSYFRPNLVIEAKTPYCEEYITALKIGPNAEFNNISRCTHTFSRINSEGEEEKDELFEMLLRTQHAVNVKYYEETTDSWLPAFGINMEAVKIGEIYAGEKVYAKFDNNLLS